MVVILAIVWAAKSSLDPVSTSTGRQNSRPAVLTHFGRRLTNLDVMHERMNDWRSRSVTSISYPRRRRAIRRRAFPVIHPRVGVL
jgi:hypothetical protein